MVIVNVGSKNTFKLKAVKEALQKMGIEATVAGFETNSRVSAQPIGKETFIGARNRALAVNSDKADFKIGIESGIEKREKTYLDFAVVYVIDKNDVEKYATTAYFQLPDEIGKLIDKGYELSDAMDKFYNLKNSKNTLSAVGFLTEGKITLKDILVDATILAMHPFYNKLLRDK